jgi:ATP-binding cassette subfamily D (ALD) protein 3
MRIDQKFNQLLLIANNHARLIGYTPLAKMAVFSKLANNPRAVAAVATCVAGVSLYVYVRNNVSSSKKKKDDVYIAATKDSKDSRKKTAVDMHFLKCFGRLLKILVPSVFCPESAFLVMVAIMLILRTYADVWMIQNGTVIEGSIIGRNFQGFKENVSNFLFAMPFISIINILLKYSLQELQLRFRNRLSLHLYREYMRGFTFYKMSNLDNRIANADQLLTQDVLKFCESVTELYSNISKPILDIGLYFYRLSSSIGAQGPLTMLLYLAISGLLLTRLRTPVGKMTVKEQQLEGTLRFVNSRVITNRFDE